MAGELMETKYYELFNNPLVRAVGVDVFEEVLAVEGTEEQEAVEYQPYREESFSRIIEKPEGVLVEPYSTIWHYKLTPMLDRINFITGSMSTTFKEGTSGWNKYQYWLGRGHIPLPVITLKELRLNCLHKCKQAYEASVVNGRCASGLGYDVDQRYSATKYDIGVVEGAIHTGRTSYFVDADDNYPHSTTLLDYQTILAAMRADYADKIEAYHSLKFNLSLATREELEDYYAT